MAISLFAQINQSNSNKYLAAGSDFALKSDGQSTNEFNYILELFPNQVFSGRYYYWTLGTQASGNMVLQTPVSWLTLSSNFFTSFACNDIQSVEYNFSAPSQPGTYNAVVQDLNGFWSNTNVELIVTETPDSAKILSYQVNLGETISQTDTLRWSGFGQIGCATNFIPDQTRHFKFTIKNPKQWFNISPEELNIPLFGFDTTVSTITGITPGNDFIYLILEGQYSSWCYFYRVELNTITDVEHEDFIPDKYLLVQNYPNPFNPTTTISWQSPVGSHTKLSVYDVLGSEVATLLDEYKPAGRYEVEFDASNLSSGVYFVKMQAANFEAMKKIVLLR